MRTTPYGDPAPNLRDLLALAWLVRLDERSPLGRPPVPEKPAQAGTEALRAKP